MQNSTGRDIEGVYNLFLCIDEMYLCDHGVTENKVTATINRLT